jgi:succinate dehydrogenase hydrophobic anchor subunit
MQLSKLFPVPEGNRQGVIIAISLFVIQLAYFHIQGELLNEWATNFFGAKSKYTGEIAILGYTFNHASSFLGLINIIVHAGLSILIIWQLYKDPFNTRFVIILSLVLILGYLGLYAAGKLTGALTFQMMSNKIRYFLSSPLKTIFSIPALKVRDEEVEEDENADEEEKPQKVRHENIEV